MTTMAAKKKTRSSFRTLNFLLSHAAAFMPLVMIPFGLLVRLEFVDSRFYTGDATFILITAIYSAASAIYLWYTVKKPQSTLIDTAFNVLFHFLTLLFVLYVSGFLSAFLAMWIVLMISADMRFGQRGFLFSFTGLVVAGALSLLVHPETPTNERIEIIQGTLVVGAIGYVIARIRAVTDKERVALERTREQEIYQRDRLLALVNSMGDAVVATDDKGRISVYNSTLLSLLDTNLNLVGKNIDDVLKLYSDKNKRVNIFDDALVRHAVFSRTDLAHHFKDNDKIKLYINVAPIQPSYQTKAEAGFIFILRDITKEKTLEEQRDEFVSVVSHELRTPVTIAEGNLSNMILMLERGADNKVLVQALQDSHEQIMYLAKLVNDLGTLAKAERGTGGETESIDIIAMLHELYVTYSPQAEAKKLHLNLDVPARITQITTNRLYLEEILQNLITNAIKYTQTGSVTLRASTARKGLLVEIKDTGIGISKADQQHIFDKFYRSEDYRTRESSGTGLGLYVCKELAEKLGFTIDFASRLNHGTTFSVLIPFEAETNASPAK